jgi:PAS domain S-box-containing protein
MTHSKVANSKLRGPLPVRLLLPLVIGIGGIAFLVFFSILEFKGALRSVEEKGRADLSVTMSNLQGAIAYRLSQHDLPGVQNVVANQSFQEQIKDVVFINEQEKVLAATRLALVGYPLTSVLPELNRELAACKGNRWKGVVRLSGDRNSVFVCYPVMLPNDTGERQRLSTGYLLSRYDLSRLKTMAQRQVIRRLTFVWLLFAAGFGLIFLLLRRTLAHQRIRQIVSTTEQLAAGALNARVNLAGRDELATIGQAVDKMAGQLQTTTQALQESHNQLESRVQERTAVLKKTNEILEREILVRLQAEGSLRQSQERYRALVDLNPDAVYVHFGRRIVYVNEAAIRLFGASKPEDLIGRSPFDLFPQETRAEIEARYHRVMETGKPNPPSYQRRLRLDGTPVDVEAVAAPLAWEGGTAIQVIIRDLTDQRKAERWVRTLIDTTLDAVISIDRQAHIVMFNPAAEKIFGYAKSEVEGKKVNILMAEPHATEHDDYIARYETTGEPRAIGRIRTVAGRRKNGESFPIELSVAEIASGEEVNYAAFIRDISEKSKLQNELVGKERLAAIGATAAQFAHEIGNPLNGMFMTAQLLERRLVNAGIGDNKVLSSFQSIVAEMKRLNSLLSEFRLLYREERYNFRPTSLAAVIRDVLEMERPNYISRGIRIVESVAADMPVLFADGDKLKQVVLNLCKNGVEEMPQGGTLAVRAVRDGNHAIIDVSDSGAGVPEGLNIFAPFKTTKSAGTGLGLVIARQIVAAHNGSVTFNSAPGKGTTFSIKLPLNREDA